MSQERARQLLRAARAINRERSRMEQTLGYAAPEDGPTDMTLRTIMVAFWAALVEEDWETVAQGYAMLGDLHQMVAGAPFTPETVH